MKINRLQLVRVVICVMGGLAGTCVTTAFGQQLDHRTKADASLVVDGTVRQVFRGVPQDSSEYLVQIEVSRSEARKSVRGGAPFPGPGESVYVHVSPQRDPLARLSPGGSEPKVPGVRSKVRVYLSPREQGGWEGATPDWFADISDRVLETESDILSANADKSKPQPATSMLGITFEPFQIQNRLALRVTSVERGKAAQEAGLEVGDVIVGAEGNPLPNANRLEELAQKGVPFSLIVVDVNTGRGAQVEVSPQQKEGDVATSSQPPKVSLGLSADPVKLGSRSALKVTRVEPNSAAAKAGLEVDDVIVAANGQPTTGPEQLLSALRKSGPVLRLTVRDSRKGMDVDVDVPLVGAKPANPLPAEAELPSTTPRSKLGAVTELAFHNDEFAVKVTEVETGSPASRAGLLPGSVIVAANGKPVLHPNDLNDAIRQGGATLKLTVVDPVTNKKTDLAINLGP